MQFYSQSGQDKYLFENYFYNGEPGFFVDIGAHDGISGSNTYLFEQLGWDGVCFEPMPHVFIQLLKNRKCDVRQFAISDVWEHAFFRSIKGHSEMLSGLVEHQKGYQEDRIRREMQEHVQEESIIKVQTARLSNMIQFRRIDLLSIDVEGAESIILHDIDFNRYDIRFMTIEFNNYDRDLVEYIQSKGYQIDAQLGVDIIFKKII